MSGFVSGAGVELAYVEIGDGPATVVVHGMGASSSALAPFTDGRVITYDRRGYGGSGAPEPYVQTTVAEQAEDLACVIKHLDAAPAVLVGEDLGALVALDLLLRHGSLARGAVLVDPPTYAFVPEATEALSEERAGLERAVRSGGPAGGLAWWLEDHGRSGREGTRDALAFFADFGALATLTLTYGGLASLAAPIAIVTTANAREHDIAAAEALLDALGNAEAAPSVDDGLTFVAR